MVFQVRSSCASNLTFEFAHNISSTNVPNSGLWLELWREGALFLKRMGFRAVRKLDAMDKREAAQLFVLCSLYHVGDVVEFGEQNPFKSL